MKILKVKLIKYFFITFKKYFEKKIMSKNKTKKARILTI